MRMKELPVHFYLYVVLFVVEATLNVNINVG